MLTLPPGKYTPKTLLVGWPPTPLSSSRCCSTMRLRHQPYWQLDLTAEVVTGSSIPFVVADQIRKPGQAELNDSGCSISTDQDAASKPQYLPHSAWLWSWPRPHSIEPILTQNLFPAFTGNGCHHENGRSIILAQDLGFAQFTYRSLFLTCTPVKQMDLLWKNVSSMGLTFY